jgi:hypothetical protein
MYHIWWCFLGRICRLNLRMGRHLSLFMSGWTQTKWFRHVSSVAERTTGDPALQLFDGHWFHTRNLDVVKLGREKNIPISFLPPHSLHKVQPLDLAESRAVSVGTETRYGLNGQGPVSGRDKRLFSSSQSSQDLRPTQPPIQWVPGAVSLGALTSILCLGQEWWNYRPVDTPSYVFMTWCLIIKHRNCTWQLWSFYKYLLLLPPLLFLLLPLWSTGHSWNASFYFSFLI